MKEVFSETILQVMELIAGYKQQIEDNDLIGQSKTRALLNANKVILRRLYVEASRYHRDTKNLILLTFETNKKKYRDEGQMQGDATSNARLDCLYFGDGKINLHQQMSDYKCKAEMTRGLMDDLNQVCIDISVNLKSCNNEVKYG
jgi:hypothetical protein